MSERTEPYSPSAASVGPVRKVATNAQLLWGYLRGHRDPPAWLFERLDTYDELTRRHLGRPLAELRTLEVGFGARPWALIALLGMGSDAWGVDVEVPVLDGSRAELAAIRRANGWERALKSGARHALFDRREQRAMRAELARRGWTRPAPRERFVVADAAALRWDDGDLDLIVSEDVLEHIPREGLEQLVPAMARWLRPEGLALVCPNVFTGITGGHQLDWNRFSFTRPQPRRQTPPWDHLRGRTSPANTYLNELTRAEYRHLVSPHFEIVEEIVKLPDLGREHLPEAAAELEAWPEEELFSNQVLFVLRPKRS